MGTNYYAVRKKPTIADPIHIGKSSMGWLFCFQTHNDTWRDEPVVWNTFNQVNQWLQKYVVETEEYIILDEYDREISYKDFIEFVEQKQNDEHCRSNPNNFKYNRNVDGYRFSDGDFS